MKELGSSQWYAAANLKLPGSRLFECKHSIFKDTKDYYLSFLLSDENAQSRLIELRVIGIRKFSIQRNSLEHTATWNDEESAKTVLFPAWGDSLYISKIKESVVLPDYEWGLWESQLLLEFSNNILMYFDNPDSVVLEF